MSVLLLVLTTVHINVIIQLVVMCVIVMLAMYLILMDSLALVRYVLPSASAWYVGLSWTIVPPKWLPSH